MSKTRIDRAGSVQKVKEVCMIKIKGIYLGMDYPTWLGLAKKDEAPRYAVLYKEELEDDSFKLLFALDENAGIPLNKVVDILSRQNAGVEFSLCDGKPGTQCDREEETLSEWLVREYGPGSRYDGRWPGFFPGF